MLAKHITKLYLRNNKSLIIRQIPLIRKDLKKGLFKILLDTVTIDGKSCFIIENKKNIISKMIISLNIIN